MLVAGYKYGFLLCSSLTLLSYEFPYDINSTANSMRLITRLLLLYATGFPLLLFFRAGKSR
jgi:hypothetical protein